MDMTDKEALIKRLEVSCLGLDAVDPLRLLVDDVVAALNQPEQEPVAWGVDWGKAGDIPCVSIIKRLHGGGIEVVAVEYAPHSNTHPPQRTWVGLTDEEILSDDTLRYYYGMNGGAGPVSQKGKKVIAAIEAKLKQKNGYAEEKNT